MKHNTFLLSLLLCTSFASLTQIEDTEFEINVIHIQQFSINYEKESVFKFKLINETIENDLIVNMYSINCKVKIRIENESNPNDNIIINQMNDDIFSFRINPKEINVTKIRVIPLLNSADERIKKNYENKTCPLIITNMEENNKKIL